MNGIPTPVAGAITIALIVGLGIFIYPWLLTRRHGVWIVGANTLLLAVLFVAFQGSGSNVYSLALAAGAALGPVIAAIFVWRLGRKE
ncbi:MAG: hypothetical protein H7X75_11320 [Burkholderiaceae bacterium]|nr:hypothetical protein [Burkholderiaceae bacterium]